MIGAMTESAQTKEVTFADAVKKIFLIFFKQAPAKKHRPVHLLGGTSAFVDYTTL